MSCCLVTGGAGFIGSHVADYLVKEPGSTVVVLDDLSGGFTGNLPEGAIFVEGSITDAELVTALFAEYKFEYVFHLAAYAAEGLSHFIRRFNYTNNLIGSVNLINESVRHEVKCFVFTSSIAVYGHNQVPMIESLVPQPADPYGIAKYAVEMDLAAAHSMWGLNYIIFRPHNVYGERQNIADPYRNVVGIFMKQIMEGQPLTIFGDGSQTRAFSYIDDVAPVIADSINHEAAYGKVFNIGSDDFTSVNQLAELIAESFDTEVKINYLEQRNEVDHAYADHSEIKKYLPVPEPTPLKLGIDKMATLVKNEIIPPATHYKGIEIDRNMPPSWKSRVS
jgi:UDP-glucose 4-epimerase